MDDLLLSIMEGYTRFVIFFEQLVKNTKRTSQLGRLDRSVMLMFRILQHGGRGGVNQVRRYTSFRNSILILRQMEWITPQYVLIWILRLEEYDIATPPS